MGLITKVLDVDHEPTETFRDPLGYLNFLYPFGTERKIKKLTFSGYKEITQICSIENKRNDNGIITTYYNKWKNINNN